MSDNIVQIDDYRTSKTYDELLDYVCNMYPEILNHYELIEPSSYINDVIKKYNGINIGDRYKVVNGLGTWLDLEGDYLWYAVEIQDNETLELNMIFYDKVPTDILGGFLQ